MEKLQTSIKKSDPPDTRNYRIISLLNVDYKNVSKVYANRLLAVHTNRIRISAVFRELLGLMQYVFKGRDVLRWA